MAEFVIDAIGLGAKPGFVRWFPTFVIFLVTVRLFKGVVFGSFENRD